MFIRFCLSVYQHGLCLCGPHDCCFLQDIKTGKTALHFAVESGSLTLTKLILDSNTLVSTLIDKQNYDLRTALHFAVQLNNISEENKIDLVQYLLLKGASKTIKDKNKLLAKDHIQAKETKVHNPTNLYK